MGRVYATVDDYTVFVSVPVPVEIPPRVMALASSEIDTVLVGARYDTDEDGLPTDPDLVAVFRDATCAQARPRVDALVDPAREVSTGLTGEAYDILRDAGLLPIRSWVTG